ncbi:tryptophan-rich sensory protein [Planctomycetaceae bacterium SH139]
MLPISLLDIFLISGGRIPQKPKTRADPGEASHPGAASQFIESKIGLIWTAISLLAGLGTATAVASVHEAKWQRLQVGLILGVLVLNVAYTYRFTHLHNLWMATGIAAALALLLLVLVATTLKRGMWPSTVCHLPHFGWAFFATYVTSQMA